MTTTQLERLLNEACELLIIFEDSGYASEKDLNRIQAFFNEIKYTNKVDSEMSADNEAQDWELFGPNKI